MAFAAVIPLILGVVGAGVSAYGAYAQGKAASDAAKYQAKIAENNATIAKNNAAFEQTKGVIDAQNNDFKNRQLFGQMLAEQGASGLDVGSESSKATRASAASLGRLDSLTIRNSAQRQAVNFENQGKGFEAEANLDRMQAKNSMLSGWIGAAGSLIGGLTSTADKWVGYKQSGALG